MTEYTQLEMVHPLPPVSFDEPVELWCAAVAVGWCTSFADAGCRELNRTQAHGCARHRSDRGG